MDERAELVGAIRWGGGLERGFSNPVCVLYSREMPEHTRSKGIVLQSRDYALLRGLFDSRLMTLKHAAALHFEGKIEAAKKRLQKLQAAGMIAQRARRPQEYAVYLVGREGYLSLKRAGLIDPAHDAGWAKLYKRQRIGDLMLAHELAVMDVKVAFVTAIEKDPNLELVEMSVWPDRHKFRVVEAVPASGGGVRFRSLYAKPDGFLHFREHSEDGTAVNRQFFFEVDRGTESLGRLVQKVRHYVQHNRKGGFAVRRGHKREDFKGFPFRVFIVFKTAARRDNVGRKLLDASAPIKGQVWLATMNELLADPMGKIPAFFTGSII